MIAVYISSNQFKVEEDHTEEFKIGRRIKANCGDDGYVYSTILSSSYSSSYTTITITESTLTSNLIDVLYGIVNIGDTGSLPDHLHNGLEGQGGGLLYITEDILNTCSGIIETHINSKPDTFLELIDTPTTYDYGKYAISTSSGIIWGSAGSSNVQTFLDLTDTPITYSGTADLFAKSTGSGIIWATASGNGYWYDGYSTPSNNLGKIDDFYINLTTNEIYKKQTSGSTIFTAKSIIIDMTNNWGDGSYVGIRSVELYLSSNKISTPLSTLLGYDNSSSFDPVHAFKNEVSKIGASLTTNGWTSNPGSITNQRIVCVFSSLVTFDSMIINNYHHSSGATTRGAKDINIYYSTDAITTATYGGVTSNSTLIFTGQLHQHVAVDIADDQALTLINNYFLGWNTVLNTINSFYDLIDVPSTYSGTSGKFAQSTGSGIVWAIVPDLDVHTFLDLNDTPDIYSEGMFAQSTSSGIIWSTVSGSGSSDVQTFLDLTDTPESYIGNDGKFVKVVGNTLEFSTISGASGLYDSSNLLELDEYGGLMPVVTISGINDIVLTASDNSRWRLIVSTTGVLSTEVF